MGKLHCISRRTDSMFVVEAKMSSGICSMLTFKGTVHYYLVSLLNMLC